ncbi:MAG TPA: hypothetical protein PLM92_02900 [Bacillota bacterium]|nr:hypothetical protein [Bacillota bacterium]
MSKFKDFLYDKNDIMVALVILIVAAVIIFFRINAIMDYPSTQTDQSGSAITEAVFKS